MTLEARALECVRGRRRLFSDLNFFVKPGDCLEVRGANGSGKTSLLKLICGLLPPSRGDVLWKGERIDAQRESYLDSLIFIGHRSAVKDEMTAFENLVVSSALSGVELSRSEAQHALRCMSLADHANTRARYLSEGQRRRLALARLVNCGRPLWLLDEVMTSLDTNAARGVAQLIEQHVTDGGMAVVATHQDLKLSSRVSRRIELAA
jgi:heme exporter protein A